jgi:chaperonin GroES
MTMECVLRDVSPEKVTPIGDRVLLEREEREERSPGGILLPDSARELPVIGIVVTVGEGEVKDGHQVPIKLRKGQKVVIPKYAGTSFQMEGKSYVVVKYSEILFKID